MAGPSFAAVIARLDAIRAEVVERLRRTPDDPTALPLKRELDAAVECLAFCGRHHLSPRGLVVTELPHTGSGPYPEFRLVDDNETEDRSAWSEVRIGGEPVRAYPGDLLIGRGSGPLS